MKPVTITGIRHMLETDDRWLLVGLLTIYKYQTEAEKANRAVLTNNNVGFNSADGNRLSGMATWLLRQTPEEKIRRNPNVKLSDYFDQWAEEVIRQRMPKYARQLTRIASKKQ